MTRTSWDVEIVSENKLKLIATEEPEGKVSCWIFSKKDALRLTLQMLNIMLKAALPDIESGREDFMTWYYPTSFKEK